MKNHIVYYNISYINNLFLGMTTQTIAIIIVALILILTLSFLNIKFMKYPVGIGISLFTFTCMTEIMSDNPITWYISSGLIFLFIIGVFDNIIENNYIVGIFILAFAILGLIFFIQNIQKESMSFKVRTGFNILIDKSKEMKNNLDVFNSD